MALDVPGLSNVNRSSWQAGAISESSEAKNPCCVDFENVAVKSEDSKPDDDPIIKNAYGFPGSTK